MSGETVRLGIVGTGAIAQIVHLPILTARDDVEVAVLADLDEAKAETIAGRFEVPRAVEDPGEVFGDPEVDGVLICSPSDAHEEQALAALRAGKHVLVEKPLALRADGVRRVLEGARSSDGVLLAGMNNRYRSDGRALKTFVDGGELGDPILLRCGWLNRKMPPTRASWRHDRQRAGGGALMDLGVQMLDFALWVASYPAPRRVSATLHRGDAEVEDTAALLVELEGGASVGMEVSWTVHSARDRHFLQVLGTGGSASLPPLSVYKELAGRSAEVTPEVHPREENAYTASYRAEIDHFLRTIRGEVECVLPEEHVRLMEIVEAAYRSAEEGREVTP